ncbi:uncharacterized protein LOC128883387 isoform X2 [Hylaeus volcanicus]|uniref:uncharacterized protein LOC128883387 isoform X2 n=1 Tax=Hylaeus volcanicus TaxID=313075 RepID=UPI0023B80375|nr:uncharacterized protein LOC128883387 isoform X2 [Hylaeus volcanicus]
MTSQEQATAAAAAMATMAVGGIAPTDPRLQPFMRIAKQEWIDLRVRVLVSNGMSETVARQEVQRSTPVDQRYFFGPALMKYIASLSSYQSNLSVSIPKYSSANVDPLQQHYPLHTPTPFTNASSFGSLVTLQNSNNANSQNVTGNVATTSLNYTLAESTETPSNVLNLSSLQRLLTKTPKPHTDVTPTKPKINNVLAPPSTCTANTKGTRFDIPLDTFQTPPVTFMQPNNTTTAGLTNPLHTSTILQQLDKALQQWTYCVYSVHHTPPVTINGKAWRSSLFQFVNFYVAYARQMVVQQQQAECSMVTDAALIFPTWLTSCRLPTVEQVLEPQKFLAAVTATSLDTSHRLKPPPPPSRLNDFVPPPPCPLMQKSEYANSEDRHLKQGPELSPVSSSRGSNDIMSPKHQWGPKGTCKRKKKDKKHGRSICTVSRGSSSMKESNDSSLDESPKCLTVAVNNDVRRKQPQCSSQYMKDFPDILNEETLSLHATVGKEKKHKKGFHGKKKFLTVEPTLLQGKEALLFHAEEHRKREDRSRRFFATGFNGKDALDSTQSCQENVGMVSVEGLRMMTWQEKLQMLTSVENVVGKSQLLEKEYLRLCGPPDPALVRPEHILKQSFSYCLEKWENGQNYRFIEEQFRSIRQDLMVQGIKNSFTVLVYETNAKIALKNLDLGQFNQCQTQLHELYKQLSFDMKAKEEFLCYRLLYLTLTNMNHDLLKLLGEITVEEKNLPGILYADCCRRALVEGNCHRFFRLFKIGPFLTSTLISIFINKLRMTYLVILSRAHYDISLSFLQKELMFDSLKECRQFLQDNNAVWRNEEQTSLDARKSVSHFEISPLLQTRKVNALG